MAAARHARAQPSRRSAQPRPRAVTSGPRGAAIRWDRIWRLAVVCAFLFVALLYMHPLLSIWSARGEAAQRHGEVARLKAERERLERRVRALRDPSALEREGRRLGMVRPGERAYVIENLPGR
jgi:cell division protein FtsB